MWIVEGKIHRIDGPAVMYDNGGHTWYIYGERVTEEFVLQYAGDSGNRDAVKSIIWKKYI